MSNSKKIGIAAAAVALMGASAGGYMMLKAESSSESTDALASASASASGDVDDPAPLASLAGAIPENVDLYIEVPSVRGLAQASASMSFLDVGLLDLLRTLDEAGAGVGKAFDLSAKDGSSLVSSFKSVAVAARLDFDAEQPFVGVVVSSDKPAMVAKLLATKRFTKTGKVGESDKYTLASRASGDASDDMFTKGAAVLSTPDGGAIVWFAERGLLVMGAQPFLEAVNEVVGGKAKALGAAADYQKNVKLLDAKPRVFAYLSTTALRPLVKSSGDPELVNGFMKDASPLLMGLYLNKPGMLMTFQGGLAGDKVPLLLLPAVPKLDIASKLPANTLGYTSFATKIDIKGSEAEKSLVNLIKKFDLSAAADFEEQLGEGRKHLGVGLSELVDAVGDQGAIGVIALDDAIGVDDFDKLDISKNVAVIGLQTLKDQAGMKKVIDAVLKVAPIGKTHSVAPTADGGFQAPPKKGGDPFISVRYPNGDLFIGVGPEEMVKLAHDTIVAGKMTLGADAAHKLALSAIRGKPQFVNWLDVSSSVDKSLKGMDLGEFGALTSKLVLSGDKRLTLATGFAIERQGEGYRFRLDSLNGTAVLPALAIFGVRRYLASSKTAEAKNTIGAISRGAAAAYERESVDSDKHVLCKSASAVPSAVPSGKKYQPDTSEGKDFESGDAETGWKCLKFGMTQPHYFQYGYTAGGPYKGPAVGGPDPGKNGFEAWAIGDLDGDGVTSLFTRTGTITASGKLKMGTQIFIYQEFE